jgi:hypothetical protein
MSCCDSKSLKSTALSTRHRYLSALDPAAADTWRNRPPGSNQSGEKMFPDAGEEAQTEVLIVLKTFRRLIVFSARIVLLA